MSIRAIYEPKGAALEYAPLAANQYIGCAFQCSYCSVAGTLRKTREALAQAVPHGGGDGTAWLQALERDARNKAKAGWPAKGHVLLSFISDPYPPQLEDDLCLTRRTIETLHRHGFAVTILTKAGLRALRDLDLLSPADAFACTLTLLDDTALREWEPHAAPPGERMEALRTAYEKGIPTWVSLEPVIDPAQTLEIIRRTHGYVGRFKIGALNYHSHGRTLDWHTFARQVIETLRGVGASYYIKNSLLAYLPPGVPREHTFLAK